MTFNILLFSLAISLNVLAQNSNNLKNPCIEKSFCNDTCTIYFNLGYNSVGVESYVNVYMLPNIHFLSNDKYKIIKNSESENSLLISLAILNDRCYIEKFEVFKSESKEIKHKINLFYKKKFRNVKFVIDNKQKHLIQKDKKYSYNLLIGLQAKI